jgi:hypothetical protein
LRSARKQGEPVFSRIGDADSAGELGVAAVSCASREKMARDFRSAFV